MYTHYGYLDGVIINSAYNNKTAGAWHNQRSINIVYLQCDSIAIKVHNCLIQNGGQGQGQGQVSLCQVLLPVTDGSSTDIYSVRNTLLTAPYRCLYTATFV